MDLRVEVGVAVLQLELATGVVDGDATAELAEDLEDLAHVGDVGHALQAHRLARQQRGAQDGQHGVLVGRGHEAAGERRAAKHDEVGHGLGGKWTTGAASAVRVKCRCSV